jgi:GT2 family glycosyltransferase
VRFLGHGENIGFGCAHNVVFRSIEEEIQGDFSFLIVNPDGRLHPKAFIELGRSLDSRGDMSILELVHMPLQHPKYFNLSTFETDWFSGAAVLIPSRVYRELNGFDENLFLYCEDVDLSIRARYAKYKIYTIPTAIFWHQSRNVSEIDKYPAMVSGMIYLAKKYGDIPSYIRYMRIFSRCHIPAGYKYAIEQNFNGMKKVRRIPSGFNVKVPNRISFQDLHFGPARHFNL